ncbi:MAG: hypothetical protein H6622_18375 [Halobacteriovoraceae bacterium]|nr:hypothetical protein [Halobacteriovoraceae bacterium]
MIYSQEEVFSPLDSYERFFDLYPRFKKGHAKEFIKRVDEEILKQGVRLNSKDQRKMDVKKSRANLLLKLDKILSECMSDHSESPFSQLRIRERILDGASSAEVSGKCSRKFLKELEGFIEQSGSIIEAVNEENKDYKGRKRLAYQALKEADLMSSVAVFKLDYKYLGASERYCNDKNLKKILKSDSAFKDVCINGARRQYSEEDYNGFVYLLNEGIINLRADKKIVENRKVDISRPRPGYIGSPVNARAVSGQHNQDTVRRELKEVLKSDFKAYSERFSDLFLSPLSDLLLTEHMQTKIGKRPKVEEAKIVSGFSKPGYIQYSLKFDDISEIDISDVESAAQEARVAILERQNEIQQMMKDLKSVKLPRKYGHQHRKAAIDKPLQKMFLEDPYSLGRALMKNPQMVFEVCKLQNEIEKSKDYEEKLGAAKKAALVGSLVVLFVVPLFWESVPFTTAALMSGAATGITSYKTYDYAVIKMEKQRRLQKDQNALVQYDKDYQKLLALSVKEFHKKLEVKAGKSAFLASIGLFPAAIEVKSMYNMIKTLSFRQATKLSGSSEEATYVLNRYKVLLDDPVKRKAYQEEFDKLDHHLKHKQHHKQEEGEELVAKQTDSIHLIEQLSGIYRSVYPGLKVKSLFAADEYGLEDALVYK